tara:strand:+ start:372 stop:776 length:405 start_codon:yes stop_codon:yes gene_type:complete
MSTLAVATIKSASSGAPVFQNTSGTEIGQICKAWVNFNGTTVTSGTDMTGVRDSFNVSSVVDGGTGVYTVNFTTAMANANYASVVSAGNNDKGRYGIMIDSDDKTTSACKIFGFQTESGSSLDSEEVSLAIFGD